MRREVLLAARCLVSLQIPRLQGARAVFLNRRAAARYRALASIIPGREKFSFLSVFHE